MTTATPDDEEELISKNKRSKMHQLTNQRDNKEIKKGRGGDLEASRHRPSVIQTGPRTRLQRIEEEPEDPQDQHRCRGTNKNTEWVPKEENHILEHPQQQEQQSRGTDSQKSPTISTRTEANNGIRQISPEQQVKAQKTNGEERKDTEESTQFTERAITLLQSLGVIQSAAKLDLYQDKRVVCVANVLNNADTASKIDF